MEPTASPTPDRSIRLSQGHLNLLSSCPRKFQHIFLEQLGSPTPPEQQEKQNQGAQFHLLLQQWQLDLPVVALVQEEPQLQPWFEAFVQAAPQILELDNAGAVIRQCEHTRTLAFQGYLLTVVYDLLIRADRRARILDWKTYPRPLESAWLARHWQTRLYLFVLGETGPYEPEDIAMVYWFFQGADHAAGPQSLTVTYDRARHEQTRRDLSGLLAQLTDWLQQYQQDHPFPQVPPDSRQCESCSFAIRCDRLPPSLGREQTATNQAAVGSTTLPVTSLTALEEIQEIPL